MPQRPLVVTNAFLRPRGSFAHGGVTVCDKTRVFACVEEIVRAIDERVGAHAVLAPTMADEGAIRRLLQNADGVLLPGGYSNMHPSLYGQAPRPEGDDYAPEHDATDLALIKVAREMNMPLLGICRGMQALNVARGGTLFQRVAASSLDHMCSGPGDGMSDDPAQMHGIHIEPGGMLAALFPQGGVAVNSLHVQGLDRLGEGVRIEARAADGIIEAVSCPDQSFCLGVQWHPEAMPANAASQTIFAAFGDACAAYAARNERRAA